MYVPFFLLIHWKKLDEIDFLKKPSSNSFHISTIIVFNIFFKLTDARNIYFSYLFHGIISISFCMQSAVN